MRIRLMGNQYIDIDKVQGIEKGEWSNSKQDYQAIFVMEGNTRIHPLGNHYYCKDIIRELEESDD